LGAWSRHLNRQRTSADLVKAQAHERCGLGERCGHMTDSYSTMVRRPLLIPGADKSLGALGEPIAAVGVPNVKDFAGYALALGNH
jgi:hypothetical protein